MVKRHEAAGESPTDTTYNRCRLVPSPMPPYKKAVQFALGRECLGEA